MIDIHSHILPGLDDGAASLEESVKMCRMAADDGITHMVASPHCNVRFPFDPETNKSKIAELQAAVGETPQILPGCDFHFSYENLRAVREDRNRFTINGRNHLLVEFDEMVIPRNIRQIFFELLSADIVPVITHPERNYFLQNHPEVLYDWVQAGCSVQITAQSVMGKFGPQAQKAARKLLEHHLVHAVASDAHNTTSRPPRLTPCHEEIRKKYGDRTAEELFRANPQAMIDGNDLPAGREPLDPRASKKRWFSRLFSGGH